MDMAKTNVLGGSLAIGHPFGATGARLVATASNRLQRENQRFALLTACADGGLAHACILEGWLVFNVQCFHCSACVAGPEFH